LWCWLIYKIFHLSISRKQLYPFMKRFFVLCFFFSSCVSSSKETIGDADTTGTSGYEDFSEIAPFTIKDDIRENPVLINGKKKPLKDYLIKFYSPDHYTVKAPSDSVDSPRYIITEAQIIEGNFFAGEGKCESRSLLFASRGDFIDQEFYDLFFLKKEAGGEMAVSGKTTFDGSQGQSSTIVQVSKEALSSDKKCSILKISSATEGGDINLHKGEWVEYYIADNQNFHSVLKLQIEETNIQDYEATQDENQNSSSELREVEILGSSAHGLFDLNVHYTSRQNGSTVSDVEELYTFNGHEYIRR
jgi:hypothetical protein